MFNPFAVLILSSYSQEGQRFRPRQIKPLTFLWSGKVAPVIRGLRDGDWAEYPLSLERGFQKPARISWGVPSWVGVGPVDRPRWTLRSDSEVFARG